MSKSKNVVEGRKKKIRTRKQTSKWSSEETTELISIVKESPILWNESVNGYKDRIKRNTKMKEIAFQLGKLREDVSLKWQNLRSTYKCRCRLMKNNQKNYQTDKSRLPRWEHFEQMSFLGEFRSETPPPEYLDNTIKTEIHSNEYDECIKFEDEQISTQHYESESAFHGEQSQNSTTDMEDNFEPQSILRAMQVMMQPQDACTIFGNFVTQQMRKLSEIKRNKLELMIQQAILKVQLEPE